MGGEKYNLEKAQEAQAELTLEQIEKIMVKVQDINLPEIAFHTIISLNRRGGILRSVLKDGILGIDTETRREAKYKSDFDQRQTWITDMKRKGKLPKVWFDISGRYTQSAPTMKDSFWLRERNVTKPLSVTLVFDLSKFKDPIGTRDSYNEELKKLTDAGSLDPKKDFIKQNSKLRNYMPADTQGPCITDGSFFYAEKRSGKARGGWDSGYVLFSRIPPRLFQGIVIRYYGKVGKYGEDVEETNRSILEEKALEIVNEMLSVDKDKPDLLLPIYDAQGNLLWPKQMSYEEVKRFVAEGEQKETTL